MPDLALIQRLQDAQVAAASRDRDVFGVGPFRVMLSAANDTPWLNYATPVRSADHSTSRARTSPQTDGSLLKTIEAMKQVFFDRGRRPKLEILEGLWPEVGPALETAGFMLEHRFPLMICTPQNCIAKTVDAPMEIVTDDAGLAAVIGVDNQAFAEETGTQIRAEEWIPRNRKAIDAGNMQPALARVGDVPASAAFLIREGSVAELAGVGTVEAYRRRGLAQAISSYLMSRFFAQGGEIVWLCAGSDTAKAVYEGLGFEQIGDQTHYIWPAASPLS